MMEVNGENMDRRYQKEIHVHELTIDAQSHLHVLLENMYVLARVC